MRKFYFLLLMVLFAAISNAQTPQYFKGGGTGSNGFPFNSTAGLKSQNLYLTGDLIPPPISGNITRLYWRSVLGDTSASFTNFYLKLGQTTATAYPSSGTEFFTGLTTVYFEPAVTINSAGIPDGWMFIDLQTPFLYDPSQTLIVEVVWDTKTAGGFNVRTSTGPVAPNNKRLTAGSPTATTGNTSSIWTDFGIDIIPAGPCSSPPTPGTSTASPSTPVCSGATVSLNLTGHTQGSGQTYVWESASVVGGPYTPISASSSISNLIINPTTTMFYRAAVTCSGNTQTSVPVQVVVTPAFPGGTYTINSAVPTGGTNYQTMAAAVSALSCGIAGPVIFNVAPGSGPYNEQVIIPVVAGTSAVNTVTFYGNNATIQATPLTATRHIIRLDGADYITFRKFNILAQAGSTFGWGVHLTNGADNNTIDSCTIDISAVTSTTQSNSAGIVGSGSTTSVTTAGSASNNTISNNTIIGGYQGIIMIGTATSLNSLNNIITKNEVRDWLVTGIEITHANGGVISYNNIHRTNRADVGTTTSQGIEFGAGNINCTINGNRIHDSHTAAATQSGIFYGIFANACDAVAGSENRVINNLIYKINSLTGTIYGLYNSSSDGVYYYHNTVVLDHAAATAGLTRGFYQLTLSTNIQFRNNIVIINRGGTGVKYCLYFGTTTSTILSNNNVLLNTAPAGTNGIGSFGTTGYTTLIDWQGANSSAYDQQSISADPVFSSPVIGDYTPTNPSVNNIGAPVGVTTDILEAPRSATTPDPGAYEFSITAGINMGAQLLVAPAVAANGCYTSAETVTIRIKNYDINPINFALNPVTVTTNVTGAVTQTLTAVVNTGSLGAGITLDVPMSGTLNMGPTGVYTFNAFTTVSGDINPGNDAMPPVNITKTVLAAGTASASPAEYCLTGGTPTLSVTGATGYGALQWQQSTTAGSGFTDIPGATTSPFTLGSPITQTMYYRLQASCNGNIVTSNEVTVILNNPQITSTTPGASCGPGPVSVQLAATGTGAGLMWYDVPSGGTPIGTGSPFNTPPISSNTTYYVSSGSGVTASVGPPTNGQNTGYTLEAGLFFDVLAPTLTINAVYVYPVGTGAGTIDVALKDPGGTNIFTQTFNLVGTAAPGIKTLITLNWTVPTGTGYALVMLQRTGLVANLVRDPAANHPGYPYTAPGIVTITSGRCCPSAVSTSYYYFYDWQIATGCESARTPVLASIVSSHSATISYAGSPYCSNAGTATVTRTGTAGGTYSSTAGLTINAANGDVTLGTSTPGTYTVTYTIPASGSCPLFTTTAPITITAAPSATISYAGSPYCSNAGTATVTRTGTAGGTYSSTAGLTINAANGDITLGTSTPGTYTVTYSIAASGGCPLFTTTAPITITAAPSATIFYTGSPYCNTAGTATVTQTGTAGGTYSSTAGLTINAANGDVTLGTSTPGTYTVTYTIAASGGCSLYTTTTSITVNNCIVLTADLSITKTDGVTTYVPGTTTTYTIIVTNTGPDPIVGATVTDIFPADITSVSWTASYAGGATGPAGGFGNISATVNLTVGGTATFTAVCTISPAASGNLVNTATASVPPGDIDPNSANNTATDTDTPDPQADLSITKTDGVLTYIPGGATIYTIVVSNNGPSNVTGANVVDVFPAAITGVSWTAAYAGGATGPAAGAGNINELVNIPAGGSATFTATCNISPGASGNLVNTATVTAPVGTTDPNAANNAATDTDTQAVAPIITVTGTLTAFTTCSGTPSAEQTFTVSGINLTANLIITAPTGFEVSVTSGSGFSGSISLTPVGGNIPTTTIYVRLSASATGTPSGDITIATTGATTQNVAVSGTVNPTPTAVATPASQTRCSGVAIATIVLSSSTPGTTYTWTRDNVATVTGIAANGSGNISGTLTNTTTAPITVTFTITPTAGGCVGPTTTATVLVNPTPNVVASPTSQTICSGTAITPIALSGNVAGTTYTWTRTNTVNITGMAASGSGNPITGTLNNTTITVQTTTFTITPSANGCAGPATTVTVTVNPNATVNAVASRTVCNGSTVAAIGFSSPVAGVTFNWTNNNTGIGLGASGTGNLPSFTATNATALPLTGTITVTATYNNVVSCVGTPPMTFTITVAPTTTVDPIPNQTVCANTLTAPVNFTSPTPGATFDWTNNTTSIGLAASGTGNIPAFTATNATTNPVTATVTVTPSYVIGSSASITLPPQSATFTGNVRGYWFIAPTNFTMTSLFVPTDASTGAQSIAVVRFNPAVPPPVFPGTTNAFTTLFVTQNDPTVGSIPVSIPIATGDVIGIMGYRATINSYSAGPNNITIAGFPVSLTRMGMQFPLTTTLPQQIWQEPSVPSVSRVLFEYSTGVNCPGTPRTFTITVNPLPTITCPANMTVPGACTASVTYTPTVTGTPAPTLSYSFSGATTGSGSGSGSGSVFNIGVTTVTITATNSCGTVNCSFTITVTDGQTPVITTQPQSQSKCVGDNVTFTVVSTFATSYQWQSFNGTSWVNIPGTNASSYTVSNVTLAMNTNSYRVLITGPCGTVTTSNHATLTVNPIPAVVISASIPPILLPTDVLTLTANTLPPPQPGGTFVWRKNGNIIAGATGPTLGPLTVNDVGSYTVTYTVNGCSGTSAALVVSAKQSDHFYVYPNPNFGQFQVRFFNQVNEQVTVTVYDSKGSQVYQRKITTTTPYTSLDVNLGNNPQGSYLVVVHNSTGQVVGSQWVIVYH